ncbi:hypothetical protein SAMN04488564_11754 [Lentzea waywayandensis]|uniref:Uncharacterized protein n=1 Tax=Lentzea waywayandensis TaxID=84724 RepID=A0A1I6FGR0_9PSEU|nr:hypothetical protein [Lentzea waywayandensis]SFR29130.1 hypothetical protein SAMN04488564_11754 [Lentzea waywayandensis]
MSSYIAAPLLVLTYGVLRIVDGLDGECGTGPVWTVGHLQTGAKNFRGELLDRTLIWNQARMWHALREYEQHDEYRTYRSLGGDVLLRGPASACRAKADRALHPRPQGLLGGVLL